MLILGRTQLCSYSTIKIKKGIGMIGKYQIKLAGLPLSYLGSLYSGHCIERLSCHEAVAHGGVVSFRFFTEATTWSIIKAMI